VAPERTDRQAETLGGGLLGGHPAEVGGQHGLVLAGRPRIRAHLLDRLL
jgi:hypothetical protein